MRKTWALPILAFMVIAVTISDQVQSANRGIQVVTKGGGVISDYIREGEEVLEVTGRNKYLDVTSFLKPGENRITYYHYNEGPGIIAKVRIY